LPHNDIRSLTVDGIGNIWLGTFRGLVRVSPDGNTWNVYDSYSLISVVYDERGYLWAGYWGALYQIDIYTLYYNDYYYPSNSDFIYAISYIDEDGCAWMGLNKLPDYVQQGMVKLSGNYWYVYHTGNTDIPSNTVGSIVCDADGLLWIATNRGIASFDKNSKWEILNKYNSELPSDQINYMNFDNKGNLWISTNVGLVVYRKGGVILSNDNESVIENTIIISVTHTFPELLIINYELLIPSRVKIEIYNSLGNKINTLVDEWKDAGKHQADFSVGAIHELPLPQGMYYYTVQIGERRESGKLLLVK
jgi:ligand-binding sensor domain-containing protein